MVIGGFMDNGVKTIIRNVFTLFLIDFVLLPAGVALFLYHGFHILHVVLGMGYLYGVILAYDTAVLATKHIRLVNESQEETFSNEDFDVLGDEDTDEPMKPEMKKAMDEVFGIKH
jgi:hypothetical protein